MNTINNKTIELARLARGYTQKDLASLLNISQSNLSKIEKDLQTVNSTLLSDIANILNYPIDFFYQRELRTPFSNIYFRKRATIPQKALDKIFADVKIILQAIDELLTFFDLTEYKKYAYDITTGWTPEAIATRIREIFKIPRGPVKELFTVIEEQGIIIYAYDSPNEKFDGLTAYTDKGYPIIFINKNLPNDRLKFTVSHELLHLTTHIPCDVEPWRDVEDEANKGAGELLMPKKDCYYELQSLSYNKLTMLKSYWGVSKALIIRRAKDLNVINEATYKYLMIELGRRNERKVENGFVDIDEPKIIKEIIHQLKVHVGFNDEKIASIMHLNIDDYYKYFDDKRKVSIKVRALSKVS